MMRAHRGIGKASEPAITPRDAVSASHRTPRAHRWTRHASRVRPVAIGAALLLAGFVGGALIGEVQTAGRAHVAGACIALERSFEREVLGRPAADAVIEDLVGRGAPFRASFPLTAAQFRAQCAEISRTAFRLGLARRDGGVSTAAR